MRRRPTARAGGWDKREFEGLGVFMDKKALLTLIHETLAGYRYEPPPTGSTIGAPWSAERVNAYVEKLRAALVEPYVQRFELREIYDQVGQSEPSYADFWVVAESGAGYLEWYDPATGEFGLGIFNGKTGSFLSLSERVEISSGFLRNVVSRRTNRCR